MAWYDTTALGHIAQGRKDCQCSPCKAYRNANPKPKARKPRAKVQRPSWVKWAESHEFDIQAD